MSEYETRNKIEIKKMNNFLECFSCKREEEVKLCFDNVVSGKQKKKWKHIIQD